MDFWKLNPVDVVAKKNSPMVRPLPLKLYSGQVSIDFNDSKTRDADQLTG